MTRSFVFLSVVFVLSSSVSAAQSQTVDVQAKDGTLLKTTLYKAGNAARPTVLIRTPYGRGGTGGAASVTLDPASFKNDHQILNTLGYHVVAQDMRGTGQSGGGDTVRFVQDHTDTMDTIDWIVEQDWSNGRVAMLGGSASGIIGLLATQDGHPNLDCVAALTPTSNVYEAMFPGGANRPQLTETWMTMHGGAAAATELAKQEALSSFWDDGIVSNDEIKNLKAKSLVIGGYFDTFQIGTVKTHRLMSALAPNKEDHYLVLGPWTHGGWVDPTRGNVLFDLNTTYLGGLKMSTWVAPFFNWCLRDGDRPNWKQARAYLWQPNAAGNVGTGSWNLEDTFPPEGFGLVDYHLQADESLKPNIPQDDSMTTVDVDVDDPVPTVGGGVLTGLQGPAHQNGIDARDDVLTWETEAMSKPTQFRGIPYAKIWASSATKDVDVIVRLSVLTSGGKAILLTDGIRRGRFVGSQTSAGELTPGTPYLFEVELGPVSVLVPTGHKLRLSIQGTSNGRYGINPNDGSALQDDETPVDTTLTVYMGGQNASYVQLPMEGGEPDVIVDDPPVVMRGTQERDGGIDGGGDEAGDATAAGAGELSSSDGCGCRVTGRRDAFAGGRLTFLLAAAALLAFRGRRRA